MCMQIPINKPDDGEVSEKDWEELHIPFNDNLNDFMIKYVIPEVVAFSIANSYFRGCLCEATFEQHYNSMSDIINGSSGTIMECADTVFELLKIKYNLVVIDDNPMKIEKYE